LYFNSKIIKVYLDHTRKLLDLQEAEYHSIILPGTILKVIIDLDIVKAT